MRLLSEKYRLLTLLTLLLLAGFLTTIVTSYISSRNAIRQNIIQQTLPLTSDNIYSEIQKDILQPIFISSLMAHDTFLRDWALEGETDQDQITRYLKEIKLKYGTIASFFVSERSQRYYHADGLLKHISPKEVRDIWYFQVKKLKEDYEINVDIDMANRDAMTIFINHKVFDYKNNFIGITGVGLTLDTMATLLDSYQARFHRTIYFIDKDGLIRLSGKSMNDTQASIAQLPGMAPIVTKILNSDSTPTQLEYQRNGATILMSSRYIPELRWYLLVEQDISDDVLPLQRMLLINIAVSSAVSLLILILTLLAVNRYQQQLEKIAGTDILTGLLNRQAFELVFQQAILDSDRRDSPLSAILLDIDFFKQINDTHGHLGGDRVLRNIATLARAAVRESDIVTRWGGEEFLILLKDCPLTQATSIAEKLRHMIATHDFALPNKEFVLTASFGVAAYRQREAPDTFFARTDQALYQAKASGRNRIAIAPDEVENII